jgi:hypothetical protein
MGKHVFSEQYYQEHRRLASHLEAVYIEIEKLAKKKPTERVTPLITGKINHIIVKVRDQVSGDDFLDAIETLPTEGETVRLDEALIILGELRSIMDRQWNSPEFENYRKGGGREFESQIMHTR